MLFRSTFEIWSIASLIYFLLSFLSGIYYYFFKKSSLALSWNVKPRTDVTNTPAFFLSVITSPWTIKKCMSTEWSWLWLFYVFHLQFQGLKSWSQWSGRWGPCQFSPGDHITGKLWFCLYLLKGYTLSTFKVSNKVDMRLNPK